MSEICVIPTCAYYYCLNLLFYYFSRPFLNTKIINTLIDWRDNLISYELEIAILRQDKQIDALVNEQS